MKLIQRTYTRKLSRNRFRRHKTSTPLSFNIYRKYYATVVCAVPGACANAHRRRGLYARAEPWRTLYERTVEAAAKALKGFVWWCKHKGPFYLLFSLWWHRIPRSVRLFLSIRMRNFVVVKRYIYKGGPNDDSHYCTYDSFHFQKVHFI